MWLNFFHSSSEHKNSFLYDIETVAGYIPASISETAKGFTVKDLKELYYYFPNKECPEEQKPISTRLMNALNGVVQVLLSWFYENSPSEIKNEHDRPLPIMAKNSPETLFRMNYYPPLKQFSEQDKIGAKRSETHADINLITILPIPHQLQA